MRKLKYFCWKWNYYTCLDAFIYGVFLYSKKYEKILKPCFRYRQFHQSWTSKILKSEVPTNSLYTYYSYFFFILFANIGGLQYMQSLLQTLVCITQGGWVWVRTWTSKAAFTIYFKSAWNSSTSRWRPQRRFILLRSLGNQWFVSTRTRMRQTLL